MSQIRFVTDEDIHGAIAVQLRAARFDAVSTPEVGRRGSTDHGQLTWAALEGRTLVTFNVSDFARLHREWMTFGRHHAGIVVSSQRPLGDLLRRLITLGRALSREDVRDRLEFLSNWRPSSTTS
jgi:hypothetical protein